MKKSIAVAKGDGIGPEIMDVVLDIFTQLHVPLEYNYVDMGRDIFLQGHKQGMTADAQAIVEDLGVLFKGPMETPKGGGNRSINVTARKMWGTFANCRRFKSLPGVQTIYSKCDIPIDITIIRENLEDTYSGVEHMVTADLAVGRRFTSAVGSYQIHEYAFQYAKQQNIKSVVCGHKANIMKLTDGMFLDIFYDVAKKYPKIQASDVIVDDLCMKLVTIPNQYNLMILPNLQGDIVSDLCAGLVGGLGFAPSANIGKHISIFEAVHGTAPDKIGRNIANPTALLMSGLMMLNSLGFSKHAKKIELALLQTLEENIHTADLVTGNTPVSTTDYGKAIIQRALRITDDDPRLKDITIENIQPVKTKDANNNMVTVFNYNSKVVGIDIVIESQDNPKIIAETFQDFLSNDPNNLALELIANRGTNVFPNGSKYSECINSYTIRLIMQDDGTISTKSGLELCTKLLNQFKILSIEFLRQYDDKMGFSSI